MNKAYKGALFADYSLPQSVEYRVLLRCSLKTKQLVSQLVYLIGGGGGGIVTSLTSWIGKGDPQTIACLNRIHS